MKILWLIPAQMAQLLAGQPRPEEVLLNLSLASARLRLGVAASYSRLKRHANIFLDPEMAGAADHPVLAEIDVCVVTKFMRSDIVQAWQTVLQRLSALVSRWWSMSASSLSTTRFASLSASSTPRHCP